MKAKTILSVLLIGIYLNVFSQKSFQPEKVINYDYPVRSVVFKPDGVLAGAGGQCKTSSSKGASELKYFDASSNTEIKANKPVEQAFEAISYNPEGTAYAACTRSKSNNLMLVTSDGTLKYMEGHNAPVWDVSYSPDGKYIASASGDNTVKLWDGKSLKEIAKLTGPTDDVMSVDFSNDNKYVAGGSKDKSITIWEVASGKVVKKLEGYKGSVSSVKFSTESEFLLSGSYDKTIRNWFVPTGEIEMTYSGHSDKVTAVDIDPNGFFIASASMDNSVRLWEKESGQLIETFKITGKKVIWSLTFNPDGTSLVWGEGEKDESDGNVKIWDIQESIATYYRSGDIQKELEASALFAPKDEFETSKQYDARLAKAEEFKVSLHQKYFKEVISDMTNDKIKFEEKLADSKKDVELQIAYLGRYNADEEYFPIAINNDTLNIHIPIAEAKSFKQELDKVKVTGTQQLLKDGATEVTSNIKITHPETGSEYSFGDKIIQ